MNKYLIIINFSFLIYSLIIFFVLFSNSIHCSTCRREPKRLLKLWNFVLLLFVHFTFYFSIFLFMITIFDQIVFYFFVAIISSTHGLVYVKLNNGNIMIRRLKKQEQKLFQSECCTLRECFELKPLFYSASKLPTS
jgi:hypothetical protein